MTDFLLTLDILKYGIMIVILLGLIASLLSPFVVFNDQSLIADGLSHVSFTALVVGIFFMDNPFYIAIPIVVVASIFIKWLIKYTKIHADSAIGIVSSFGFALGLILIRYTNSSMDLESLISGNLWFRTMNDVYLTLMLLIIGVVFVVLNYRKLLSLTFDYEHAKFSGIKVDLYNYVFAALTGVFVVIGVRSIGVLLISSLLILPVITANLFAKRFVDLLIIGPIVSTIVIGLGIVLAHQFAQPAGSVIVILYTLVFLILFTLKKYVFRRHS